MAFIEARKSHSPYAKALADLIEHEVVREFCEATGDKQVCCFKVELDPEGPVMDFLAHVVSADRDPVWGEYYKIEGYTCYTVNVTKITTYSGKELYNRYAVEEEEVTA